MVRICIEADMQATTEIYRHHVLHGLASFETEPPSLADMCQRRADVLAKGLPYLVADLDALIGECEARDLRQMIAVIGDSANIASMRLHKRCGFRHAGTLHGVGYKHGKWLDSVLMQRTLGAGETMAPGRRDD